jgi:hypothetical protein
MAENRLVVTRRSLLQIGWRAAALVGLTSALPKLSSLKRSKDNLEDVTAESFKPYEGLDMVFSRPVAGGGIFSRSVALKLAKVTTHKSITQFESQNPAIYGKRSREPFSLIFELKGGEPLGEGLHRIIQRDFAGCQLFLSQVSRPRPDGTLLYEAVFG